MWDARQNGHEWRKMIEERKKKQKKNSRQLCLHEIYVTEPERMERNIVRIDGRWADGLLFSFGTKR